MNVGEFPLSLLSVYIYNAINQVLPSALAFKFITVMTFIDERITANIAKPKNK